MTTPTIAPVPVGVARPKWSVMIPTFNCALLLRETLASVLAQDPGPDRMQIEVVDDVSTKDDPEAVVKECAPPGRVTFHRHPQNVGAIANFNACIVRSRGELVHILHGDDSVEPGFYAKMERLADQHPRCALIAARAVIIDEDGIATGVSPDFPGEGEIAAPDEFHYHNPFVTPGVVVRRGFYEEHGGFDPRFPHVADWEMWLRAIERGGGALTRQALTRYRVHAASDTNRLARTAGNIEDYHRLYLRSLAARPSLDAKRMRQTLGVTAYMQAGRFVCATQREAFVINRHVFWQMHGPIAGALHIASHRFGRFFANLSARFIPSRLPPQFPRKSSPLNSST